LKYTNLTTEIQNTWHATTKAIPVKTGTKETISKTLREYLKKKTTRKLDVKELQKITKMSTNSLSREILHANIF
jgi:IS30 family transposase